MQRISIPPVMYIFLQRKMDPPFPHWQVVSKMPTSFASGSAEHKARQAVNVIPLSSIVVTDVPNDNSPVRKNPRKSILTKRSDLNLDKAWLLDPTAQFLCGLSNVIGSY